MSEKTYVYENVEVRKTGRTATRPSISKNNSEITLYEITPLHEYDGLWKKWVMENALFTISEQ